MRHCTLPKLSRGDTVAVLSPSAGLPGRFPHVYELGIKRLREKCGLKVLEYPTTRMIDASAQERARDVVAAFRDPKVKAIFASIGGSDQSTVLPHLDAEVMKGNPKPFFGYSDNTNLCTYLWKLGVPSYYGASIMCQFGMQGEMDDLTLRFIRHALFTKGSVLAEESSSFTDDDLPWGDVSYLDKRRQYEPHEGNIWDAPTPTPVAGRLYGGCVESLDMIYKIGRWHPEDKELDGIVLCLETSEERPPAYLVERFMMCMGVRGILSRVSALLVARPKTNMMDNPPAEVRNAYRKDQREAMLREFRRYNPTAPVIFNMNFGHTDPQMAIPLGHIATIDPSSKKITFEY